MTKKQLRLIIGENIRNERASRNISIDELAEMLGLTAGFVGLIERGQRGTTANTLFKLASIFDVTIDSLFLEKSGSILSLAEDQGWGVHSKRQKITSMVSGFTEEELDFVIQVIKGLRTLNHSNADIIDDDEEDYFDLEER